MTKYTTLVIEGELAISREMELGKVTVAAGAHYNVLDRYNQAIDFLQEIASDWSGKVSEDAKALLKKIGERS